MVATAKALHYFPTDTPPTPLPPANPPSGVSDLERSLARLQSSTVAGAGGRESGHVVLYEDVGKRRVKALVAAIRDLQVCVERTRRGRGAR